MLGTLELNKLRTAAAEAVESEKATGIPAELMVSQWAIESDWGFHQPHNNCFGIKEYPGCPARQLLETHEWFSPPEIIQFKEKGDSRTATVLSLAPDSKGRRYYLVEDWFASFPRLADCFNKWCRMFTIGQYAPLVAQYHINKDMPALIRGVAAHYSTGPRYSDSLMQIISMPEVIQAIIEARKM